MSSLALGLPGWGMASVTSLLRYVTLIASLLKGYVSPRLNGLCLTVSAIGSSFNPGSDCIVAKAEVAVTGLVQVRLSSPSCKLSRRQGGGWVLIGQEGRLAHAVAAAEALKLARSSA